MTPHIPIENLDEILTKAVNDFYDYITERDIIKAAHEYSNKTIYKETKQQLETLITSERQEAERLGRVKERKKMSQELEELSDFAFVNYPDHELERAIKDYWRTNEERIKELESLSRGNDE